MVEFSLVIPTLNEERNILPLVQELTKTCIERDLFPEIIFVDDDSSDNTRRVIKELDCPFPVRCIHRKKSKGLTGAVIEGARQASTEVIAIMDADLSHPAARLPAVVEPVLQGSAELTIGSRYIDGGQIKGWSKVRHLGSIIASWFARFLTPDVRDPLAGFFCTRRKHILAIDKGHNGFKIVLEILNELPPNSSVREIPITFTDRCRGTSKMNSGVLTLYLQQLARLFCNRLLACQGSLFLLLGLLAASLDIFCFWFLQQAGFTTETAQITGLGAGYLFGYSLWFLARSQRTSQSLVSTTTLFGLYAVYLGLLRGAFSPFSAGIEQLLPETMLLYSLLSYLFWCLGGVVLFLTHSGSRLTLRSRRVIPILLIAGVLLHLTYMGKIELLQEEAYYWNYSMHPAAGYLDHPPAIAWLISLGTFLFGTGEFGVRFGAFLCWGLTGYFSFRLSETLFDRKTAWCALLLICLLPIFFGAGLFATPDAPLICSWAGLLYFLHKALFRESRFAWFGAGLWLGLGMISKYTMAFLGPGLLVFMLIDPHARKFLFKLQPWLALLLALCIFSPVIWWNSQNNWASFLFQSEGRLAAASIFTTHILLLSILLLLTPLGAFGVLQLFRKNGSLRKFLHEKTEKKREAVFFILLTFSPLFIILFFSFTKEVKLNWTGPLWLALLPYLAHSTLKHERLGSGAEAPMLSKGWAANLSVMLCVYSGLFYFLSTGWPTMSFPSSVVLTGYENFSGKIANLVRKQTRPNHPPPVVVGMDLYKIASGLAFYNHKEVVKGEAHDPLQVTGRHLVGGSDLMYQYWLSPHMVSGRDLLLICKKKEWLADTAYARFGSSFEPVEEITVFKNDSIAGKYYARIIRSYSPGGEQMLTSYPVQSLE